MSNQYGSSAPITRQRDGFVPARSEGRNRPEPNSARVRVRRSSSSDRVGLWAILALLIAMFVAVSSSAEAATTLGDRVLKRGMEGRDVRHLQLKLKGIGLLGAPATAHFGELTYKAVKRFQRSRCLKVDGLAGPVTVRAIAAKARRCKSRAGSGGKRRGAGIGFVSRTATWYGPGLYGRRTACGLRLTRRLQGVAHRTLPCGSRVRLSYGGRSLTVRVVDRGPYTSGITFDLTAATARSLGMSSTSTLRASY